MPFTFYVQAGFFTLTVFAAGLGMGLVINNLLVVNNYRDAEEDALAGKRTLIVRFGRSFGRALYTGSYSVALLIPIFLGFLGALNLWIALLVPFSMVALVFLNNHLLKSAHDAASYDILLAQTAKSVLFYGIAFGTVVVLDVL